MMRCERSAPPTDQSLLPYDSESSHSRILLLSSLFLLLFFLSFCYAKRWQGIITPDAPHRQKLL